MLVKNWMKSDVVTVDENIAVIKVSKILKDNNIRHLPVTKDGKLSGIITDHDVREAMPYKMATLNVHEVRSCCLHRALHQ